MHYVHLQSEDLNFVNMKDSGLRPALLTTNDSEDAELADNSLEKPWIQAWAKSIGQPD